MSMTCKHFTAIAQSFAIAAKLHPSVKERTALLTAAQYVAGDCAAANPSFDRARFLEACKLTGHEEDA